MEAERSCRNQQHRVTLELRPRGSLPRHRAVLRPREAGLLAVSRRWFAGICPGDDTAIGAVLAREHSIYASDPRTTLAGLADMVTRHLPA